MREKAPHSGGGALKYIPAVQLQLQEKDCRVGPRGSSQGVAAQRKEVCLAGSSSQLPQPGPSFPSRTGLDLFFFSLGRGKPWWIGTGFC